MEESWEHGSLEQSFNIELVKVPEQSAFELNSMMAFLTASSFTVGQYSRTVFIRSSKDPAFATGISVMVMTSIILFFIITSQ